MSRCQVNWPPEHLQPRQGRALWQACPHRAYLPKSLAHISSFQLIQLHARSVDVAALHAADKGGCQSTLSRLSCIRPWRTARTNSTPTRIIVVCDRVEEILASSTTKSWLNAPAAEHCNLEVLSLPSGRGRLGAIILLHDDTKTLGATSTSVPAFFPCPGGLRSHLL